MAQLYIINNVMLTNRQLGSRFLWFIFFHIFSSACHGSSPEFSQNLNTFFQSVSADKSPNYKHIQPAKQKSQSMHAKKM